ncbi:MAG: UDP-N-acetylmuramate dehydrogenase [Lawsonibacter sp.]|nr:UDP-N-acetylmuramate dehydrogenase [Lawsonibacter sp.]
MDRFETLHRELTRRCPDLDVRVNEPMSHHTSFHIGGPAALMALPKSEEEAAAALQAAAELEIQPFFMGNGSNLLVPDEGVERFLVKAVPGLCECRGEETLILAGSGITLARLAVFARDSHLTGLEFAHGIPGSLGGAVTMNAGAYDGEMSQLVCAVTCLTQAGERETVTDFGFGYRRSTFSDGSRMILSARLELAWGDLEAISAKMEKLSALRQSKQPLEYPSAGSMFKRPPGHFAAALIEQCGLKGFSVGGAQVSEKHAGFVVNRGGATCGEVLELVDQVRRRVLAQAGVELELEVRMLR